MTPGTRLGPYEIGVSLGAGGMGEVYRARDTRLGRDVAIKALPPELSRDPERLVRFEREARLLASLSHPNIAGIHGLETADGTPYLALEFVEGETLAARLARGPLPLDEAIDVAGQIAAGVEAAHESGVIHRDLKPVNVMLTPAGQVKVLDFGLAKAAATGRAESDPDLSTSPTMTYAATQAGMILGTAAYMSPEQARGKAVDKRTDVWAFGCVLYECLTGRRAFAGETVSDLIAGILKTEPAWDLLPAATPARVRALLRRCFCKDPRERLRDIGEARIALGATAETEAPAVPAPRPAAVRWRVMAVVTLAVAFLAVLAALRFGPTAGPGPLRKFDLVAGDMVVDWPIAPVLSPDGSRFAYASENRIWVRDLDRLTPRAVAEVAAASPVNWSPDSRTVVYADKRKLWQVPAEGGQPTAICEIPGTGDIIGAAWSAAGTIAFSVWRDRLYEVAAGGGVPKVLVDLDPVTQIDFHGPSWLPNGELMYVTHWQSNSDSTGQKVPGLTFFDGRRQILVPGDFGSGQDAPILTPSGHLLYLLGGATPGIWAVPFDLKGHRATGTPVLVGPAAVTLSASADGSLLYSEGAELDLPRELVWVDRAGVAIEAVGRPHAQLYRPSLSPDGRRVAFTAADGGNVDVWVLDLETEVETRLTFGPLDEFSPEWLPSSSRLAYVERDGMQARILAINADGSGGQRELVPTAFSSEFSNVAMAPDGRSALRVIDQRGHGSLRVGPVLPDGSLGPLEPLLKQVPEPNVRAATISPDGRLVAYTTNDPGQVDVFLTRFPSGEGQWQVGTQGGVRARWAPDGRELLFIAGSGPTKRSMVSARVDPAQDPPLGPITPLFDARDFRSFDVAPDGQRILTTRPVGGGDGPARHLVLVQNWQSGLSR
ncbi:MAG: serine/threonine-protein kinase [Krumholzibacteria bacterium]|nr:serine/threonine-protein kinase [Candidatus Krumholzibacteria bacterium]